MWDLRTEGTIMVEIKLRKVNYDDSGQGPVKGYWYIIIIIRIPLKQATSELMSDQDQLFEKHCGLCSL